MERALEGEHAVVLQPTTHHDVNLSVLILLGTLFFGFIPALVVVLLNRGETFMLQTAKNALNWAISMALYAFLCVALTFMLSIALYTVTRVVLMFILVGFVLGAVLALLHFIFCLQGAYHVSHSRNFQAPFTIRFLR